MSIIFIYIFSNNSRQTPKVEDYILPRFLEDTPRFLEDTKMRFQLRIVGSGVSHLLHYALHIYNHSLRVTTAGYHHSRPTVMESANLLPLEPVQPAVAPP